MKRKSKKIVNLLNADSLTVTDEFHLYSSLIEYSDNQHFVHNNIPIASIQINAHRDKIQWLNTYGFQHKAAFKKIIQQNQLDEFLLNLTTDDNHRNKVVELNNCFFLTLKSLHFSTASNIKFEQLIFIVSTGFIWSIQEKKGDHFGHIRTRLKENKGVIRRKNTDYLLYLLIESIIENYYKAFDDLAENGSKILTQIAGVKPDPKYIETFENDKNQYFLLKKAVSSLREAISQIEKIEFDDFNTKYFVELKEQASFLLDDIDFNLQQLESSINLILSLQGHYLNEVMKTLTILSVIFIPLTFIAGIYGMNFNYIPELAFHNAYFVLLGVMVLITFSTVFYFKRKNWF